jgi:Transcription-silencing protein, cryptic loci regulator Clr2
MAYDTLKPPPMVFPDGTINFWYRLPKDNSHTLLWKQKIGTWIAKNVLLLDDARKGHRLYYLKDFPENYVLYQQRKGHKDDPRTDCYLESNGRVHQFRSPAEFYEHAAWLIQKKKNGLRRHCMCNYCKSRRKQLRKKAGLTNLNLSLL